MPFFFSRRLMFLVPGSRGRGVVLTWAHLAIGPAPLTMRVARQHRSSAVPLCLSGDRTGREGEGETGVGLARRLTDGRAGGMARLAASLAARATRIDSDPALSWTDCEPAVDITSQPVRPTDPTGHLMCNAGPRLQSPHDQKAFPKARQQRGVERGEPSHRPAIHQPDPPPWPTWGSLCRTPPIIASLARLIITRGERGRRKKKKEEEKKEHNRGGGQEKEEASAVGGAQRYYGCLNKAAQPHGIGRGVQAAIRLGNAAAALLLLLLPQATSDGKGKGVRRLMMSWVFLLLPGCVAAFGPCWGPRSALLWLESCTRMAAQSRRPTHAECQSAKANQTDERGSEENARKKKGRARESDKSFGLAHIRCLPPVPVRGEARAGLPLFAPRRGRRDRLHDSAGRGVLHASV